MERQAKVLDDHKAEGTDEILKKSISDEQTIVFTDKSFSYVNIAYYVEIHHIPQCTSYFIQKSPYLGMLVPVKSILLCVQILNQKLSKMMRKITFMLIVFLVGGALHAQDRMFTYTYQSNVEQKGEAEIEVWNTLLEGRSNYYFGLDHRLEYEMGLGGHLQTSVYLNYGYLKRVDELNGTQRLVSNTTYSFSNEWKYQLTNPIAKSLGSALYFEYTLSPSESDLEGKIIVDKRNKKTVQAFNLVGEYEFYKNFNNIGNTIDIRSKSEFRIELNYGFAYLINKDFAVGLEVFNQNQISRPSGWESSVLYSGPSISYKAADFSINLTLMPQITDFKKWNLELQEHEKLQARLILSYDL